MSEEINEATNNGEVKLYQKYIHFSQSLDPNIKTDSLTESKYLIKIYFREPKRLCFSFEFEGIKEKKIWIYRNVKIEGENDALIRKFYLLELFFTIPMRFDFQTIKIQN